MLCETGLLVFYYMMSSLLDYILCMFQSYGEIKMSLLTTTVDYKSTIKLLLLIGKTTGFIIQEPSMQLDEVKQQTIL